MLLFSCFFPRKIPFQLLTCATQGTMLKVLQLGYKNILHLNKGRFYSFNRNKKLGFKWLVFCAKKTRLVCGQLHGCCHCYYHAKNLKQKSMKKLLAVLVIAASLSACGSGNDNENTTDSMNTNGMGNSDATMQPGTDTSTMMDSSVNGTGAATTPGDSGVGRADGVTDSTSSARP